MANVGNAMSSKGHHQLKLLTIGDSGIGKTCFIHNYINTMETNTNKPSLLKSFLPTFGVDLKLVNVVIKNTNFTLLLWDTAGQERFRTICTAYYSGAHGVVFMFDVTNEASFAHITNWLADVKRRTVDEKVEMVIVGNKADLVQDRVITTAQGQQLAQSHGMKYFEISAKSGRGINEVWEYVSAKAADNVYFNDKVVDKLAHSKSKSVDVREEEMEDVVLQDDDASPTRDQDQKVDSVFAHQAHSSRSGCCNLWDFSFWQKAK